MCRRELCERFGSSAAIETAQKIIWNDRLVDLSRGLLDEFLFALRARRKSMARWRVVWNNHVRKARGLLSAPSRR